MLKKTNDGWLIDIQPGGRGAKRYRKTFATKAEALAWEAWLTTQINQQPQWQPAKKDLRKLSHLIDLWHEHHGAELRAGKNTYSRLKHLCTAIGDPVAEQFSAEMFTAYRSRRLMAGITPNSVNREHAYLRSVFNELRRLGHWKGENPLSNLRQFKVQERELTFLAIPQVRALLAETRASSNPHTYLITKVCLSTGARWGEAEGLRISQVRSSIVQFSGTKSGKTRAVPIDSVLADELANHHAPGQTGERLFSSAYSAFRECVDRLGLVLPDGQLTHVLRHTFASHFMMSGGNILALQKILGHASLMMTMRYAHLAPEHLQEAIRLNPVTALQSIDSH